MTLNLQLPPLEESAKPAFANAADCAKWISQFQLTDFRFAHQTLSDELDELNRFDMPALERLKITEQLRDSATLVQGGYAKRIIGKPLPLSDAELAIFRAITGLWARMVTSYSRCLAACIDGDSTVVRHQALISQRCLRYTGYQIVEYTLMNYQVDPLLWRNLHQFYRYAEEKEFAQVPVLDSLKLYPPPSSCADHYIRTVLTCQANPYELPRKHLQMLNRWLDEWVAWVSVTSEYPANAKEVPPLAVDLDSGSGAAPTSSKLSEPEVRYLDVTELSKNLRIKTILLQQGQSPAQLGLGEDCVVSTCQVLLEQLHQYWCEGKAARVFEKRSVNHRGSLCFGLPAIHYLLSGKVFQQPARFSELSLLQHEEIAAFGHIVTRAKPEVAPNYVVENWDIQDESHLGFTLMRNHGAGEQRLSPGYLIGLRPEDAEYFMPCMIRWIIVGLNGDVNLGLRLLAGVPEPIAMRATGVNLTVSEKYVQAILLKPIAGSKMSESLIMPGGWFMPKRVVEVIGEDGFPRMLKLETLVGKGADYERVRFTEV